MNTQIQPNVGMRFRLHNSEFEVCYVQLGWVRYAAVRGGKPFCVTYEHFQGIAAKPHFELVNADILSGKVVNGNWQVKDLNDESVQAATRRYTYAQAASRELATPNSIQALTRWVSKFAAEIGDDQAPCPRSVSHWVKQFRENGRDWFFRVTRQGNRKLAFTPEIQIIMREAIKSYIAGEVRDAKDVEATIEGQVAARPDLTNNKLPSSRTLRRLIKNLDPYVVTAAKQGNHEADKALRAAGESIKSPRAMHTVQIDTRRLDVFVVDPDTREVQGRPYLSMAIDVRTRCVVGYYISMFPASATTTLAVIKDMLTRPERGLPGGVPIYLVPDNGVEFRNTTVARLCVKLLIQLMPAEVRNPDGKPHIERFFLTLAKALIHKIPGTTFSNTEQKGAYKSEGKAYATLDQLRGYIDDWIENEYHRSPHSMLNRVPIQLWKQEYATVKPVYFPAGEVDRLARVPSSCRINQGRVYVNKLYYKSHALSTLEADYKGQVTVLVDELCLERVYVEHPLNEGQLIQADSIDPAYTQGLSLWQHNEARKLLKEQLKEDLAQVGPKAALYSRYLLLAKIHEDSAYAKKQMARLKKGKSVKELTQEAGLLASSSAEMLKDDLYGELGTELTDADASPSIENDGSERTNGTVRRTKCKSFFMEDEG